MLSHESAGAVLGLGGLSSTIWRFTSATERPAPRGVQVDVAVLAADDVTTQERLPITTAYRTIFDLVAGQVSRDVISPVVTDAAHRDLVELGALFTKLISLTEDLPARGDYFIDYFLPDVRPELLSPRNLRAYAELAFPDRVVAVRSQVDRLLAEIRGEFAESMVAGDEPLDAGLCAEIVGRIGTRVTRIDDDWDEDEIDTDDALLLTYQGKPFTGEVVEHGFEHLWSRRFFTQGIPHGPVREWWANGSPKLEGQFRYGTPYDIFREWHHNGQPAAVKHFNESGRLHRVEQWDKNGNPVP